MTETKRCSNCGKYMILWLNQEFLNKGFRIVEWKCGCGNSEIPVNTFEEAWEKANKK